LREHRRIKNMRHSLIDEVVDAFEKSAIGFNRVVPAAMHTTTYPPFNVVKEGEGKYVLEMALAGYSRDDISVSKGGNFLTISGEKSEDNKEYIYRGIAARKFKREVPIANGVEVTAAEMRDGILKVCLENKEAAVKQIPVL
jgi:molecular chaperone IbpA